MRIGSLFSGIGGLELGLEMAGIGDTVWQVEQNKLCLALLKQHWPEAQRFDDVCAVGKHNLEPVDLICGGFPCQDVSSAGKRAGLDGARSGLWYEYARIVDELRPRWVVVENVTSGAKLWVDAVRGDLERLGYATLPIPLSAADVGAAHERARVFLVAHAHEDREHARAVDAEVAGAPRAASDAHGQPPRGLARSEGLQATSDADCAELRDEPGRIGWSDRPSSEEPSWAGGRFAEPDMVRVVHGVSRGLDSPSKRIAALGNSVVPQCAQVVGWVIQHLILRTGINSATLTRSGTAQSRQD